MAESSDNINYNSTIYSSKLHLPTSKSFGWNIFLIITMRSCRIRVAPSFFSGLQSSCLMKWSNSKKILLRLSSVSTSICWKKIINLAFLAIHQLKHVFWHKELSYFSKNCDNHPVLPLLQSSGGFRYLNAHRGNINYFKNQNICLNIEKTIFKF